MKFRQKALLCMVWLLTLSYGIGGAVLIRQSFASALSQRQTAAVSSYRLVLQSVQLVNAVDTRRRLENVITALQRMNTEADWVSLRLVQGNEPLYTDGTVFYPFAAHDGVQKIIFSRDEAHFLQLSGTLRANGEAMTLDIVYPISSLYETQREQLAVYRRVLVALLLGGGLVAWSVAYVLTRPLSQVSAAARRLSGGDLTARAEVHSRDEVGVLAQDFNAMAQHLAQNMQAMQEAMQQQEQFMGSFAHELKTPMTSVIGYADLLRSGGLTQEESMDAANTIFCEGKRLEALSMKLLKLMTAKEAELPLLPTQMLPFLRQIVASLSPIYAEYGITLRLDGAPGVILADCDLLRSLLLNLLDNSRKAMEHGGSISLVSARAQGLYQIHITDTGCGMPPQALAHITEAFYRVDKSRSRKQGGAGLGLALCQQIVQLHHGQMTFASQMHVGTCVTLQFPEVTDA